MRNRSCTLLVALASASLSAQTYMPFIGDSTRMWNTLFSGTFSPDCVDNWTTTFWFGGDSLIDGIPYTRMRSRTAYHQISSQEFCYIYEEYDNPSIFLREDSGVVSGRYAEYPETLLYDFNSEVGDSVPEQEPSWAGVWGGPMGWRQVQAIDSLLIDGNWRRRWILDTIQDLFGDTVAVIEGIGGYLGPFSSFHWQVGISHCQKLICVLEQGNVIHGEANCILVGVDEPSRIPVSTAFPNPSDGRFQLDTRTADFVVFTPTGSKLQTGKGSLLDLSSEPDGAYLVRAMASDGRLLKCQVVLLCRP